MVYAIAFSVALLYLALSRMSYTYMGKILNSYYIDYTREAKVDMIVFAMAWPLALPIFWYNYKYEINAVKAGLDYADVYLPQRMRESFREKIRKGL